MDYRDAIPDELFSDYCHMNDGGRSQFSMLLARRLRAQAQSCDAR